MLQARISTTLAVSFRCHRPSFEHVVLHDVCVLVLLASSRKRGTVRWEFNVLDRTPGKCAKNIMIVESGPYTCTLHTVTRRPYTVTERHTSMYWYKGQNLLCK